MDPVLDHAPCGYLSFVDDGKILDINKTLKEILGYGNEPFTQSHVEQLLTVSGRIFYNTHLFPLLRLHHKANEIFLTLIARDKTQVPVLVNASRRMHGEMFINECVFIPVMQRKKFEDELVNARRQAEEALKKNEALVALTAELEEKSLELDSKVASLLSLNQNLVEFNKIISHDFQEPIRKIEIFARRLAALAENPASDNELNRILASVQKLRLLTSTLHLYVELADEQVSGMVHLERLILSARDEVSTHLMFTDFDFTVENIVDIQGYERQLQLLFHHLIENSVLYRNENRRLHIHIRGVLVQENIYKSTINKYRYVDCLKIRYSDNGMGFDEMYNDYVFGLLKKIERKSPGLGMGLAVCKRVVENHSGSIKVSSQPGQGCSFDILLPVKLLQ
ncbi:MAG TPA: ATP-binding protein [Chryseosolibacter sp.]|nr:ATP-binding protein [Chryseosolibacter sp.]